MQQEYAISLISCKLGNDPQPYYVVGTGLVSPEESEARTGRIIIFQWVMSNIQTLKSAARWLSVLKNR